MRIHKLLAVALPALLAPLASRAAPPTYHISSVQPLPGEGSWDYLTFDQRHDRLFVTRVGGVSVFNTRGGSGLLPAGDIPGGPGVLVNRAVPVEALDLGFTSNGDAASTTIFRLSDLSVVATVKLGESTDAALYDAATGDAVFFSKSGNEALVFDLATRSVVGHVPLGSAPEFAVADHNGTVYVNLPSTGQVAVIDIRSRRVVASVAVDPSCQQNSAMAIDEADRLLFVGCFNGVLDVINDAGRTVSTFPTGPVTDALVYDPGLREVFAPGIDGSITSILVSSATKQSLLGVTTAQPFIHTLAENPKTHVLYTDTSDVGAVPTDSGIPLFTPGTFRLLTLQP